MNKCVITTENFSETNRDIKIGDSLYRVCRDEDTKKWYIHETFGRPDGSEWAMANWYYTDSLQDVIERINSFTKEKEIVSIRM